MPSDLVSVIVPALDEAPTLVELYERTAKVLDGLGRPFEFILIDDGSRDETPEVAERLRRAHPNVVVIHHTLNHGKSIALMQGFGAAEGAVAVTLDADLQDRPEMIPRLLEKLENGYDLVSGNRTDRRDGRIRRLTSRVYNWFVAKVFKSRLTDVNCGLKAMRREVYKGLELYGDLHRLIPILAELRAYRTGEVAVEHDVRRAGKSKYPVLRYRGILDIIALIAMSSSQTRPFHFFCELAFGFWILALVTFAGWATLALGVWGGITQPWRVVGTLLGGLGTWSAFVGTVLPLFGFFLEVEARRLQDSVWRRRLVKEVRRSDRPG